VFINGKAAFRNSDPSAHCGGSGKLIEGSSDVIVGDGGGGSGGGPGDSGREPGGGEGAGAGSDGGHRSGASAASGSGGASSTEKASAGSPPRAADSAAAPTANRDPAEDLRPGDEKTLRIQLLHSDYKPLGGTPFQLTFAGAGPSGERLDGNGSFEREGAQAGPCTIAFDLDARDAEALPDGPVPAFVAIGEVVFARRDQARLSPVATGPSTRVFQRKRLRATVVEVEHFRDDGAVLIPIVHGAEVTAVDALANALAHATEKDERALVTGHALPGGEALDLSRRRALSALHALTGDDAWIDLAAERGTRDDLRAVLQWAAFTFGYDCDPDTAASLEAAYRGFARGYGPGLADGDLGADGSIPRATWAAVFDLYQRALADALAPADLSEVRSKLHFIDEATAPLPPPPAKPYLLIRPIDQIYPVKLSKIATGTENNWQQLNPLNPGSLLDPANPSAGWRNMKPGERIYLVPDWAPAINAAGYDVRDENAPQKDPKFDLKGRPLGYAHLILRSNDSLWPVKLGEEAVHNANRASELTNVNPHLLRGNGQWKDLYPGDEINLPDDEWANHDIRERYKVEDDPKADPQPQPVVVALARAVGCREHHLQRPHATAPHRRASERRAEILFFAKEQEPLKTCADETLTACDSHTCHTYDPREYDFAYAEVAAAHFELEVVVEDESAPPAVIADAMVTISAPGVAPLTTGADGQVRFSGLARGRYHLTATHRGYLRGETDAIVGARGGAPANSSSVAAARAPVAAFIQLPAIPRFELFADFDRSGSVTLTPAEHDARKRPPGAIVLPDLDVSGRTLPATVTAGPEPTLDCDATTHDPNDPQLLPFVIRPVAGTPQADAILHVEAPWPAAGMANRMRFFDGTGQRLKNHPKFDHYLLSLSGAKTDLRITAAALVGWPRGDSLSLDMNPIRGTEGRLEVSFWTVDASGRETDQDAGVFTVAPLILMHHLLDAERIYVCEKPSDSNPSVGFTYGNEPSVTDLDAATRIAGVPLVRVPPLPSIAGDSWLQDQFLIGFCHAPSGMMRVAVHLPRIRTDVAPTGVPDNNLGSFVRSHLPSRNLGLFRDFWRRTWWAKDTQNRDVSFPFAESTLYSLTMGRVFALRNALRGELAELSPVDVGPEDEPTYSVARSTLKSLFDRVKEVTNAEIAKAERQQTPKRADLLRARLRSLEAQMKIVDAETPLVSSTRFAIVAKGKPRIEFTPQTIDQLHRRLAVAHDAVNYGGNVLASPPTRSAPFGKVLLGSNLLSNAADKRNRPADPDLRFFLRAQKQPVVEVNTSWLDVGHIDELVSFVPQTDGPSKFAVVHASPGLAMTLIQLARSAWLMGLPRGTGPRGEPEFYLPRATTAGSSPVTHLLRGKQWYHHHPVGAFAAVVPPEIYIDMFEFFTKAPDNRGAPNPNWAELRYTPGESQDDRYYPANLSVVEANHFDRGVNWDIDNSLIKPLRAQLESTLEGAPLLELPLMFDSVDGLLTGEARTSAFTPNLVNLQVLGTHLVIPRPYGPRMRPDDAIFVVRNALDKRLENGSLSRALHDQTTAQLTRDLIRRRRLNLTVHWAEGSDQWRKPNGGNLDLLAEIFADGFPPVAELSVAQRKERIRAANPSAFAADGRLLPGWHRLEFEEGRPGEGTVDLFELYCEALFAVLRLRVHWVDSWFYHVRQGELHCGTHVLRRPPAGPPWWTI
jgi:hypothetical protein